MATVSEFAQVFKTTANTVRNWANEFSQYLGPAANPPAGETRFFGGEDARVMALIGSMRQQGASYEQIHRALAAGERGTWPPDTPEWSETEQSPIARLAHVEGKLAAVQGERDRLIGELEKERLARIAAEKEAARLAAKLEFLESRGN